MEIEEKAEEYIKKFETEFAFSDVTESDKTARYYFLNKVYKDGYKQGQKDDKSFCESICMKGGKIAELQKKYDELNDFNNSQCAKLLKENEVLKDKLKYRHCGDCKNFTLQFTVRKLEEQIEKMKCCLNCKWIDYSHNEFHCFCKLDPQNNQRLDCNCDKWELAE